MNIIKQHYSDHVKAVAIGLYRQGNSWETISVLTKLNVIDVKIMISKYLQINVHYL